MPKKFINKLIYKIIKIKEHKIVKLLLSHKCFDKVIHKSDIVKGFSSWPWAWSCLPTIEPPKDSEIFIPTCCYNKYSTHKLQTNEASIDETDEEIDNLFWNMTILTGFGFLIKAKDWARNLFKAFLSFKREVIPTSSNLLIEKRMPLLKDPILLSRNW